MTPALRSRDKYRWREDEDRTMKQTQQKMHTVIFRAGRIVAVMFVALLFSACATDPIMTAKRYEAQDLWLKVVIEYRKAFVKYPGNIEYKSRLRQAELKAADFYYQKGRRFMDQGEIDAAIVQYQHGLTAMRDHSKLQRAMKRAVMRKEANIVYIAGMRFKKAGRNIDARIKFEQAIELFPRHQQANKELRIIKKAERKARRELFALSSRKPVTLNFRQTSIRSAYEFLARFFKINVIFDDAVRAKPVTLFVKDITLEQALSLLVTTSKTFYKKIGPNTILVAPDTPQKRGQYEDYIIRTFHLNTIKSTEMVKIIRAVLKVSKLTNNKELNTLIVRDTKPVIKLVEKLIANNDRKIPGLILDVEILEVNRTKAEQLGFDFGSYEIGAAIPPYRLTGSFRRASNTGTLTVPSLTFRFFKQDVEAKTLANPKIRVLTGKSAKIHIGDRVPLRASTITETTGQVRTTFNYTDIGIRLNVEPTIHLDNSVTVKLDLEVSTLGENLGTPNDPAFRIGTRNASTVMLLRDGETAILGGLIRDEERRSRVKIPLLGSIPIIGALFTRKDDSSTRTDILLTITPRVVRGWDLGSRKSRSFYSGSANSYSTRPIFAALAQGRPTEIKVSGGGAVATAVVPITGTTPASTQISTPLFRFSRPVYQSNTGDELVIELVGQNIVAQDKMPVKILYNPQLLQFVSGQGSDLAKSFNISADPGKGLLTIDMGLQEQTPEGKSVVLGRITLRSKKPGVSYLVYRSPRIKGTTGIIVNAQVRASRVVIK